MTKFSDIYYPTSESEKVFINNIWTLTEENFHRRKEIILPKGTAEIIFNFSDTIYYSTYSIPSPRELFTVFINGINFKPVELIKTGRQRFLGIQMSSIGFRLLFNIPPGEFNNIVCDGSQICSELSILANELFDKKEFAPQVEIILSWIRKKNNTNSFSKHITRAQQLMNCNNLLTVAKVSREVCISERQLRRFSQDWMGMNTEEFILYRKYLHCLHLLHTSTANLTGIGLQAGYYDQSHFIREFRSFTNMTPSQYKEARAEYPGHILLDV
ncbi:MAG: helix-turn-helix transcriptional regulator [Crocinitomicaceae bacterium]|nr:helix-turn-helix transcriptional regulator [Crocinitomicaceae bacterium]